eukprot:scaffold28019_cov132-Isochrysis_galbana.AAC.3
MAPCPLHKSQELNTATTVAERPRRPVVESELEARGHPRCAGKVVARMRKAVGTATTLNAAPAGMSRSMVVRLGDSWNVGGAVVARAATTGGSGEMGRQHSTVTVAMQAWTVNREEVSREIWTVDARSRGRSSCASSAPIEVASDFRRLAMRRDAPTSASAI